MSLDHLLIYGANGYTGRLVARMSAEAGGRPILAGRSEEKLAPIANELGLAYRVFGLDDPDGMRRGLREIRAVLHCAGPFERTARPMVDACIAAKAHYLDITGELGVFEALAARDAEAKAAGVMLLPGAGFDVVPTDCLAAHLASRVPGATSLVLALASHGGLSHGTATTMVEHLGEGGWVRSGGRLKPVRLGHIVRSIDFGDGIRATCMAIPWGDVSTAWHTTRIPDIAVLTAAPRGMRAMARASGMLGPLLRSRAVRALAQRWVEGRPAGPTDDQRQRGWARIFGEVVGPDGARTTARLVCPEGYTLTARTSLEIAQRVLRGELKTGFQTPARAYGPDLVLAVEGVTRADG